VEKPRAAKVEPRLAPVPKGPATLFVDSHPSGAQVSLDGAVVGRTPLLLSDVRAGEHRVRLTMPMRRVWQTTVDVPAGQRTRVAASLEELQ
jgi:hypothetical protein